MHGIRSLIVSWLLAGAASGSVIEKKSEKFNYKK